MSANAITKTWSGSSLNNIDETTGVVTLAGNHISLSITPMTEGEKFTYESNNLHTDKWTTGNRSYTIQWSSNEGCTLKVTGLSVSMCTYGTWFFKQDKFGYAKLGANDSVEVTTNFFTFTKVSDTISADLMAQMVPMELSRIGNFSDANPFVIRSISLEYTLVPDAPVLGDTKETSVDVTTDETNPNYVDLVGFFSAEDHYGEYLAYECSEDNAVIEDGMFYATVAGTYHVKAYVAALDNCHDESERSAEEFVITVNPEEPTALINLKKENKAIKVMHNGKMIIRLDGKCYNALGATIR